MEKSILIKNARFIVTCDSKDQVFENSNLLIENGEITYIGSEEKIADKTIDAKNMIVYPGLINTHHHLFQYFTRNLPQVQNLELFDWLTNLYEIWKFLNDDVVYYSSLTGMGELLKSGCTTCLDHHYLFPNHMSTLIDSQFNAASDLGVRMFATRGSMDLSKKDGGLPPDTVVQTLDEIMKDSERLINKYHNPEKFSMQQVALAPCSPFSVTRELLSESAKLAKKMNVRLHTHLAETIDEEKYTLEHFKMRPLEYMDSLGWVGPNVWYAHGIHFNDEELKVLAKNQTGVAHCPISNMKLSSGIAKIPRMLELGVPVGLAVDGSASNDGSNLLEELRVAYLLHRLNSSNKAPNGYDILKIATNGSAKILGRQNDLGQLSVGFAGDLFMISLDRLEMVGAKFNPKSLLGSIGFKNSVDYTIVNGKVLVENGRLTTIDEEKITEKANNVIDKFLAN